MSSKAGGRKKKAGDTDTVLADNRRARYNFAVEDTLEAGIQLLGTEVKALREGRANIAESYVYIENNEAWLCLLYTSPSPRDRTRSRMPSSA